LHHPLLYIFSNYHTTNASCEFCILLWRALVMSCVTFCVSAHDIYTYLRITFDCQALCFEFGYSILYFCLRAFHDPSLLIDKILTTESVVNHVHCVNPRGKYDRKMRTCGQAHKFAVVQMIRHSFKETSAVNHEMYNFLSPETIKKSNLT
jgi:hypothetical protein